MPKVADFKELESRISYDTEKENEVAVIKYYYHNVYIGTATVDLIKQIPDSYHFMGTDSNAQIKDGEKNNVIIINIKKVLIIVLAIAGILIAVLVVHSLLHNYNFVNNNSSRITAKRRRKLRRRNRKDEPYFSSSRFNDFDL